MNDLDYFLNDLDYFLNVLDNLGHLLAFIFYIDSLTTEPRQELRYNVLSKIFSRDPVVAQQLINLTSTDEDAGSIPGLSHWVKDLVLQGAMV